MVLFSFILLLLTFLVFMEQCSKSSSFHLFFLSLSLPCLLSESVFLLIPIVVLAFTFVYIAQISHYDSMSWLYHNHIVPCVCYLDIHPTYVVLHLISRVCFFYNLLSCLYCCYSLQVSVFALFSFGFSTFSLHSVSRLHSLMSHWLGLVCLSLS